MSWGASGPGSVLEPGEGERIWQLGNVITVKATAEATGGAYTLLEQECAGAPPPRHVHDHEEEAFYVLEGTLDFFLGDEVVPVGPGSFCLVPRGLAHTFRSTSENPARLLILLSPSGFEDFFRACEDRFPEAAGMPTPDEAGAVRTAIAPEFGLRIVGPPPARTADDGDEAARESRLAHNGGIPWAAPTTTRQPPALSGSRQAPTSGASRTVTRMQLDS